MPGPPSTEQAAPPTAAGPPTSDEVLAEVRTLLVDVIGDDFLLDTEIELDTSFNEDLELESIEFVALSERLLERYGSQVDFVAWMAEMDLDEIIALTVGELVDFIVTSLG
ncbi:MAG TPA: acyl carrier protein [Acidimicrobiales bacterium]